MFYSLLRQCISAVNNDVITLAARSDPAGDWHNHLFCVGQIYLVNYGQNFTKCYCQVREHRFISYL